MSELYDEGGTSSVDFAEAAGEGAFSGRQLLVMSMLGLLVLFDGLDTQMLAVVAHDLTRHLDLDISSFGIVFSAGLLGAVLGALILSPLADMKLGRKRLAVGAMALASIGTILTPLATSLGSLLVIRFIAGVGLGAAIPAIFTLVSEFAPRRYARAITTSLIAFMPLGSFLGGMLGRLVVPQFGWEMLLYLGGALTLLLAGLAALIVPESVRFLLHVKKDPEAASRAARRLLPNLSSRPLRDSAEPSAESASQPVKSLFDNGFWKFTLLIWLAFIMNQGILYFVLSWTPALLESSGLAASAGMNAAATFGIGGALGTALQGWLAMRFNIYRLMFVEMALYVVAILLLPVLLSSSMLAPAAVFFIAFGICAYQAGFILIVIEAHPNAIRTTGFGWAFGIGRIGATSAPILAGALVGMGWTPGQIFAAAAVPGVVSVSALVVIAALLRRQQSHPRSDGDRSADGHLADGPAAAMKTVR